MPHRRFVSFGAMVLTLFIAGQTAAQEAEDRTLLDWDQMRAIINEASGERAMQHILELVPYPRVRPISEYSGNFRESEVMAKFAREYGYSSVEIESFPTGGQLWQPVRGELWMVEPVLRKLYDIHDVAISLAGNSRTGDVTAEVVDVGAGARPEDYAGRNLTGKIVLGSAGVGTLSSMGGERGAVGAVGYNSLRPDDDPDQILSQSIGGGGSGTSTFGWAVGPRIAREISAMIARGERVVLRSIVEAETMPGEIEVVHATIPGDGSSDQVVIVSAHLYEGYIKQGANDDNSGCAVTLEMGRTYIRLINEGKLPRPKRTIHFLWVPEFSGTNAWLDAHPEVQRKAVADLNFDMEGIGLAMSGSFWVVHRTPDTFPTFLNDVAQSFVEFVAETNRERVRYRSNGYAFTLPILSPSGSRDPFYTVIDKHYGASDHVAYMQRGIPAVMFITWPDPWYHSSEDTPDKLDPTQFKRVAVVGTGAMAALASADDIMALRVANESLGRGTERMGEAQRKGLSYLADIGNDASLAQAYKEARNAVRHQAGIEKDVVLSAGVLFADTAAGRRRLAAFGPLIDQRSAALQNEITAAYRIAAQQWGVQAGEPPMTAAEREASRLLVERIGTGGGRGGGGGNQNASPADRQAAQQAQALIPQHMRAELNILLGQGRTALEIRDFLSGEFEPLPLDAFMSYLRAQERVGAFRLVQR